MKSNLKTVSLLFAASIFFLFLFKPIFFKNVFVVIIVFALVFVLLLLNFKEYKKSKTDEKNKGMQ
jgi:hypothetical protein